MSQIDNLKNELVDIGGSKKNMCSNYFNVPEFSADDNIKNALGHWPEKALTMIGLTGLNNIQEILDLIKIHNIEGDILEAGVWRGGACIFIKKYMNHIGLNKKLFVCDSFEGLPKPQIDRYNVDIEKHDTHHYKNSYLGVSLDEVINNFKKFEILDENLIILKGWFKDTLKDDRIQNLSLLRMDGDMYSSTLDILNNLYNKVVKGGFIIIDDYGLDCCKEAIHDFFNKQSLDIKSKLKIINHSIAYFQKD